LNFKTLWFYKKIMEKQLLDNQDYDRRMRNEILHWEKEFKGRMSGQIPPVWQKVEEHFGNEIEAVTGVRNLYEYVARHVGEKEHVSILGLGSGPSGNELDGIAPLLKQQSCQLDLTCIDINESLLDQADAEAAKRGVNFRKIIKDINKIELEPNAYDVIVAYSALHHFIELNHIAYMINLALNHGGIFVTVDIPTRNGYLMWDETYEIVSAIFKVLPPKFKIAHSGYTEPIYVDRYENKDYSEDSFECIRSEDIIPALRAHLREIHFVPALAFARRFFNGIFGYNYDLDEPLDRAIFEYIMGLDNYYVKAKMLKPEVFFGAYSKKCKTDM
jgi:SAM-dependent methyltransferase